MESLEVLKLVDAGFTADEIRQMMNPQQNNPQNSQENPQEPVVELVYDESIAEEYKKEQEEKKENPVPQEDHRFDQLNETMQKLIKTIQTSNLHNNSIQSITETDINTQVDQIMAGIIRPEHEKKGD